MVLDPGEARRNRGSPEGILGPNHPKGFLGATGRCSGHGLTTHVPSKSARVFTRSSTVLSALLSRNSSWLLPEPSSTRTAKCSSEPQPH